MLPRPATKVPTTLALLMAALLLGAQLVALGHYDGQPSGSRAAAQIAADAGLCPLCLLAFHSPTSSAPPVTTAGWLRQGEIAPIPRPVFPRRPELGLALTRAPPLS